MLNYPDCGKLKVWFGDFGGDAFYDELTPMSPDAGELEAMLFSEEFEAQFRKTLKLVCPEAWKIRTLPVTQGTEVSVVPARGKAYSAAGQLTLAAMLGKKHVVAGAEDRAVTLAAAKACRALGLEMTALLSCELGANQAFVRSLQESGCQTDADTCRNYFDLVTVHAGGVSRRIPDAFLIAATANYPDYPYPALSGLLASVYGADIRAAIGSLPDCVAVPIRDGTEAIALMKAFMDTGCRLATVEDTVAQEYHTGESIMTRSADSGEKKNTVICPELADWWHTARVMRLGCDRLLKVDTAAWEAAGLSRRCGRAAALASERTSCKKILMAEVS